jgi:hypothetical protein
LKHPLGFPVVSRIGALPVLCLGLTGAAAAETYAVVSGTVRSTRAEALQKHVVARTPGAGCGEGSQNNLFM